VNPNFLKCLHILIFYLIHPIIYILPSVEKAHYDPSWPHHAVEGTGPTKPCRPCVLAPQISGRLTCEAKTHSCAVNVVGAFYLRLATWQLIRHVIFTIPAGMGLFIFFTMLAVEGNFCAIHFFPALPAGFFFYAQGLLPLASSLFTGCLAPCMRPACPPTAVSSPFSSRTSALSWDAQLATPACLTGSCGCSSCQSFIVALGPSCLYSGRCPVLTFAGFVMYVASPIAVSMIDD
jgi:hypothetical protein